jgi:threonine aldolase
VETNIVIFYLKQEVDEVTFIDKLKEYNIFLIGMGGTKLRFVTHLDYSEQQHKELLKKIKNYLNL